MKKENCSYGQINRYYFVGYQYRRGTTQPTAMDRMQMPKMRNVVLFCSQILLIAFSTVLHE